MRTSAIENGSASAAPRRHRRLERCFNIEDLRQLARTRLPAPIFHYLDGGAEDELTMRRNTAAFDEDRLIPRCLVDVSSVRTTTRILGQLLEWPVFCSPTGASRFYHPDGELAVARAAAHCGTLYSLSTMSTHSLDEVAAVGSGPKMFQLYAFKDGDLMRRLIEECRRAGYNALCLTVDAAARGKRERELRSGMGVPMKLSARSLATFLLHPAWCFGQARRGQLSMPTFAKLVASDSLISQSRYIGEQQQCTLTWNEVRELIELWHGPFAIKGIMCADDARRAADVGATAVIVSNHGGRQLDGAAAPFDVLPDIARAVGEQVEVVLDGGIRRGTHVLKALARGARACSIGRPYLFGLAAAGEPGVIKALTILRSEFVMAMKLCGCTDSTTIDDTLLKGFSRSQEMHEFRRLSAST
jgi:L-lactate dehydrogenase (cytochrome)